MDTLPLLNRPAMLEILGVIRDFRTVKDFTCHSIDKGRFDFVQTVLIVVCVYTCAAMT